MDAAEAWLKKAEGKPLPVMAQVLAMLVRALLAISHQNDRMLTY
jgi:hypothetical protein